MNEPKRKPTLFFSFAHDRRREELLGTLGGSALVLLAKNRENVYDKSICDVVKLERALQRLSRHLKNSMSVFVCLFVFFFVCVCFCFLFLCKSQIVHAIEKCAVFGGFSVCRRLQKSRTFF